MLLVYDSRTGNVDRFVQKTGMAHVRLTEDMQVNEPFVLVSYTTGFGQVPEKVAQFLKRNSHYLCGVAGSGNRNWGDAFARCADKIAAEYRVPLLHKFELSGTQSDVETFREKVSQLATRIAQ